MVSETTALHKIPSNGYVDYLKGGGAVSKPANKTNKMQSEFS